MNVKEIKEYWTNAMALSSKSVFANLQYYLIESGDAGLELLNENSSLLSPVLDVQKITLKMQEKKSAVENKKYFLKLADQEMTKARRVLHGKFDQTCRLLIQLGVDVSSWSVDNFFDKLAAKAEEEAAAAAKAEEEAAVKKVKRRTQGKT